MDLQLSNQVAVVIGGASGIGLATARAFAAEGAPVAVLDRNPDVAAIAQQIGDEFGVAALGRVLDVTNYEDVRVAAAAVEAELGPVHWPRSTTG
ncbi:MAG: SDR family NAD(P)-dependent oxidoreductase [Caldilineaceae bacterium]